MSSCQSTRMTRGRRSDTRRSSSESSAVSSNVQHAFGAVAAGTAVEWMKGLPYPALLAIAVRKAEERRAKKIVENEAEKAANPKREGPDTA